MKINDKDAVEKFNFVKKVLKERAFMEAIKTEDEVDNFKFDQLVVEPSYTGPTLDENVTITPEW